LAIVSSLQARILENNQQQLIVPNKDIREVRAHYSTLRELVIQHPGGWEDADALAKVGRLCGAGMAAIDDPECHAKLRTVETQAADLFSREGHRKWQRKNMSGADYLRLQILIALEALNARLFFIETQRGEATQAR
jgi:hypothetical protein